MIVRTQSLAAMLKKESLLLILLHFGLSLLLPVGAQSDVRIPPSITRSPIADITYRAGARIVLECEAKGSGTLSYYWTKDNLEFSLNNNRLEGDSQRVIIKEASSLDAGYYQCSVSSNYGKALSNTSLLQMAKMGDSSSKQVNDQIVIEGEPFEIKAQPHTSFPRPSYSWEIAVSLEDKLPKKVIFDTKNRIQMDDDGNLYFAYAIMDDARHGNIYKLVTFNQVLDQRLGGSYTRIIVTASLNGNRTFAPSDKDSFPSADATYTAVVGRNFSLRCFFSSRPQSRNDWKFPDSLKRPPVYQNEKTELFLKNVQPEDEGTYVCRAWNEVGEAKRTFRLEVEAAPVFKNPADGPRDLNATEGDTVIFRCKSEGEPTPTTVWYMDGEPLDVLNTPPRMRFTDNNRNLIIENICKDCDGDRHTDLMVIQCNTSNTHGYTLGTGYLNVLKKTGIVFLSDKNHVEVESDDVANVTFKCQAMSDPSTPVSVEWRKVDPDEPERDNPVYPDGKVVVIENEELKFIINENNTDRWRTVSGEYRCRANNTYSWDFKTMSLFLPPEPEAQVAGLGDFWWIFVVIAVIIFLIILILCCCIYHQRNRGDTYPVDQKERLNGNDPEKEIEDSGFQDYRRPTSVTGKSIGGSLGSTVKLNYDDDHSSAEYDVDPRKFTEDGSFVGAYTDTVDRQKGRYES